MVVEHAYFLTLIDKRCTALHIAHSGEHFAAFVAEFFIAVTAYYSRMVVIFKVKSVPGSAVELFLPACKCRLHLFEIERRRNCIGHKAVCLHMVKAYHHIKLFVLTLRKAECVVSSGHRRFADNKAVIMVEYVMAEFL